MKRLSISFSCLILLFFFCIFLFTESIQAGDGGTGTITVCKMLVDQNDNPTNGASVPGARFTIDWFMPSPYPPGSSGAGPVLSDYTFETPLKLNTHIPGGFGGGNNAECRNYTISTGHSYFYKKQILSSNGYSFGPTKYNDTWTVNLSPDNLFDYSDEFFNDTEDDDDINGNSDGHIFPYNGDQRKLLMYNKITSTAPSPTPSPTSYHLGCSATACVRIPGAGNNSCTSEGSTCSQSMTGNSAPSSCGPYAYNQTCTCSGPCCPGTCANGLTCGQIIPVTGCNSQPPQYTPSVSSVTQPDGGTTIFTRFVTVNWNFNDTGTGCSKAWGYNCNNGGSSDNNEFVIQIDNNQSFTSPEINISSINPSYRTYTTNSMDGTLNNNTRYYIRVCATNNGGVTQTCSSSYSFTKQNYPTGSVAGTVGEYDLQSSAPFTDLGALGGSILFSLTASNPAGVTSHCSATTTSSSPVKTTGVSCTVTLNNTTTDPDPTQIFTMGATGYNTSLYTDLCEQDSGDTCTSTPTYNLDLDTNGGNITSINQPVYFAIGDGATFFKIKNSSFQSHSSISSLFPISTLTYDSDDVDNTNYLITGDSTMSYPAVGTAVAPSSFTLGYGLISQKGWSNNSYKTSMSLDASRFLEYVNSRKQSITIGSLSELTSDLVNVFNGPLIISDDSAFDNKNITLIVTESVSINMDAFIPENANIAIIAPRINFYSGSTYTTEAHGIFVADTIDFGIAQTPLKISGNIISTQNPVSVSSRTRTDNRRPSFFIVFNPEDYIKLLSTISTSSYQWKQLQ